MLLGLLHLKDEGIMNFRNVTNLLLNDTASRSKRPEFSSNIFSLLPLTPLLPVSLNRTASFLCHPLSNYFTLNFEESESVWRQVHFQLPLDTSATSVEAGPKLK
jgi:hypothetical protein